MKIRWTGTSIRFRITPAELQALEQGAVVQETLRIGAEARISAAIEPGAPDVRIEMAGADVRMSLPDAELARLSAPDAEGVYFQTADDPAIRYCIEKDFPCAHPRAAEAAETATGTFPAPKGFEERKQL